MRFQFTKWANADIGDLAFELPALPYGVSYDLKKAVDAYREAVIDGETGSEQKPLQLIASYDARYMPDIIAKLLIQLHADHSGLDGSQLILAAPKSREAEIRKAEALLTDLYRQLPAAWEDARCAYAAAVAAERDYDVRFWDPAYNASKGDGPHIPEHINAEMERLQDVRWHIEAILLDMPAPSLAEFAIKYLICFDSDRDNNGYTDALCAEAKRLLGVSHDPEADELTTLLANLNWRASA